MQVAGKRISIMGYGRSGKAAAELLLKMGAKVFVSEQQQKSNAEFVSARGRNSGKKWIRFEFGSHTERILDADMIIISPGVHISHPIIRKAKSKNIPVIGELEFASRFIHLPIIAVTGTNGKTTTACLIQKVLTAGGIKAILAGNIGTPLSSLASEYLHQTPSEGTPSAIPTKVIVLEVSTFQLESIESFRPNIGIILNITPDHLDRHKSFEEYRELKLKLLANQTEEDFAILNFDDPAVRKAKTRAQKLFFSTHFEAAPLEGPAGHGKRDSRTLKLETGGSCYIKSNDIFYGQDKLFSINEMKLKWAYLLPNYLATIIVGKAFNLNNTKILAGLQAFSGVPHRMEEVGVISGVRFINNSMCTNPEAFKQTLASFKEKVILIAGGKDKKINVKPIITAINKYTKSTVLIGETAKKLANSIKIEHTIARNMEEAVNLAYQNASQGDTVLLSPGFASFDWFRDFIDRGEKFKSAVEKIRNEKCR